jgi:hypothetical protein
VGTVEVCVEVVGTVLVVVDPEPDPVVPEPPPLVPDPEPEAGEHDSATLSTGSVTGSEIDDSGVPAGTFTVKDTLPPPATVTVTTHESAWATGIAAIPEPASTDPPVTSATSSFRLLNTLAFLLPPGSSRTCRDGRGVGRTLLAGSALCNAEPFVVVVCLLGHAAPGSVSSFQPR